MSLQQREPTQENSSTNVLVPATTTAASEHLSLNTRNQSFVKLLSAVEGQIELQKRDAYVNNLSPFDLTSRIQS